MPAGSRPDDFIEVRVNGDVDVNWMTRFIFLLTISQSSFVDLLRPKSHNVAAPAAREEHQGEG